MAFRLKLDEPIEKGFRRIATEQVQRARTQISAGQNPTTEIHEARKCMKRIRALLRLVRDGMGEAIYRAENARFRAIARSLSPARDESVVRETLAKLVATASQETVSAFERFKAALRQSTASDPPSDTASRAQIPALLDRAVRQIRRLHIDPDSFETLERGLVRNYRRGIRCFESAYVEETDEAFHEWRKCVQTHGRHMQLLSRASPPLFEAHIATARELSQMLGDDHDIAMVRERLDEVDAEDLSCPDRDLILRAIEAQQRTLRRGARLRGQVMFAERPKAHGRRISAIWTSAVALARDESEAEAAAPGPGVQLSVAGAART